MAKKVPFFDIGLKPAISLELRQVLKNCQLNLFLISYIEHIACKVKDFNSPKRKS